MSTAVETTTMQMKTGRQVICMDDLPKTLEGSCSDQIMSVASSFWLIYVDAFCRLLKVVPLLDPNDFFFKSSHQFLLQLK